MDGAWLQSSINWTFFAIAAASVLFLIKSYKRRASYFNGSNTKRPTPREKRAGKEEVSGTPGESCGRLESNSSTSNAPGYDDVHIPLDELSEVLQLLLPHTVSDDDIQSLPSNASDYLIYSRPSNAESNDEVHSQSSNEESDDEVYSQSPDVESDDGSLGVDLGYSFIEDERSVARERGIIDAEPEIDH